PAARSSPASTMWRAFGSALSPAGAMCESRLSLFQRFRIDYVNRLALGVCEQPVDRAAVDAFVLLLFAVAEVRRTDHILQLEQRMCGADDRLALVDVYRREAGPSLL